MPMTLAETASTLLTESYVPDPDMLGDTYSIRGERVSRPYGASVMNGAAKPGVRRLTPGYRRSPLRGCSPSIRPQAARRRAGRAKGLGAQDARDGSTHAAGEYRRIVPPARP